MNSQGLQAAEIIAKQLDQGVGIDIPALVVELESKKGIDATKAFVELLNSSMYSQLHRYAVAGLRTLAELGRLQSDQAIFFLERSIEIARIHGNDELYDSIEAVAWSEETAPALIDFVGSRLLTDETLNLPDQRWIAFTTVSLVMRYKSASIPKQLVTALRQKNSYFENDERKRAQCTKILAQVSVYEL